MKFWTGLIFVGGFYFTGCSGPQPVSSPRENTEAQEHVRVALIHRAQNFDEMAREDYEKALKDNPNQPEALVALGDFEYDKKNYQSAASYYKEALETDPKNPYALTNLAMAYMAMNLNYVEAVKLTQQAAKQKGIHQPYSYFNMALAYYHLNEFDDARTAVLIAENLAPPQDTRLADEIEKLKLKIQAGSWPKTFAPKE